MPGALSEVPLDGKLVGSSGAGRSLTVVSPEEPKPLLILANSLSPIERPSPSVIICKLRLGSSFAVYNKTVLHPAS